MSKLNPLRKAAGGELHPIWTGTPALRRCDRGI